MEEEQGSVASDLDSEVAETIEGNEEGQVGQRRRRRGVGVGGPMDGWRRKGGADMPNS